MTMTLRWIRGFTLVGALAGLLAGAPARAEQIVLFDITYTHTNANDSHHSISGAALNQPANWTAPIDYAKGTIHFYQEVMTKPSTKPTIIDFCLISARDYGCIETFIYTHTGLLETVRSMAGGDVDKRNVIDFTQRMRSIQMVLKTPAPTWINGGRPQSDYLPSMMRFVATLVSPGGTYVRPKPTPGFAPGDGGVAASPADGGAPFVDADVTTPPADAGAVDAPVAVDMGTGGTGGSGGSGGSSPTPQPQPTPQPDASTSTPPPSNPMPRPQPPSGGQSGTPTKTGAAGGCSVGGQQDTGGTSALVGLMLIAAMALASRRRR
jgi:MYXO-CTERM domain-containing protein